MYASPYQQDTNPSNEKEPVFDGSTWKKGEQQPSAYKDVSFAIIFILQIAAVVSVGGLYGIDAFKKYADIMSSSDSGDEAEDMDLSGVGKAVAVTGVISLLASSLCLLVMVRLASVLIKTSLLFSAVFYLGSAFSLLLSGSVVVAAVSLVFCAITVCYVYVVWSRIPFATANLVTGCTAVKANFGISLIGYLFSAAAFGWSFLWLVAFIGVYDISPVEDGCYEGTVQLDGSLSLCAKQMNYGYVILLLLSYFWAHQVFMNVVHTSVAGTVGTWWFAPEEDLGCCSSAVTSSVMRSCTFSFGSICFGSLIVALIQTLRQVADSARKEQPIISCVIDCILGLMQGIAEYFNKWAYVYVGLYGYGYVEAGKNVFTLFKHRGWETIIADDLVGGCLGFVSLLFGVLIGVLCLIMEASSDWFEVFGKDASQPVAFGLGFVIGFVVNAVILNVIGSAVNATIVLFAESPSEFASNHPSLSFEMRSAYVEYFPDSM